MDNLTHSLAGAVLGQMGLKRRTGLAMPALIIGANLPDIDAVCAVFGTESLAMRRGLTHGPIALVVLPPILIALLLAYHRWRPNPKRLPVHRGWLLVLAYIGTLSHPALDWLNSYGIRLLEPFSSRWFAGDTLFIIDVWIWAALVAGVWLSRRRERQGTANWRNPAIASFAAICAYIAANGLITDRAEGVAKARVDAAHGTDALVVASPVPVEFWRRDVLWRDADSYGAGRYALGSGVSVDTYSAPHMIDTLQVVALARERDPRARAFLFWSRMPVATIDGGDLVLRDQRFASELTRGNFEVRVPLDTLK